MFSGCVDEGEAPPKNMFSHGEAAPYNSAQDCLIVVQGTYGVYCHLYTLPWWHGASTLLLESCGADATEL